MPPPAAKLTYPRATLRALLAADRDVAATGRAQFVHYDTVK
jgi:hypothetical protein